MVEEFAACPLAQSGDFGTAHAKLTKAAILGLVHRHAADDVVEILAGRDRHQQLLGLAKLAFALKPVGIGGKFGQHAGIGCKPGERMQRMLVAIGEFEATGAIAGFEKQRFDDPGRFADDPAKFAAILADRLAGTV